MSAASRLRWWAMSALGKISSLIAAAGPIGWDTFTSTALYDSEVGFYLTGGIAGRRSGDFITSPEVGPLFGAVVARWLDKTWRELGEPHPFVVAEVGAGPGTLARTIRHAKPECRDALEYNLVEISAGQREQHGDFRSLATLPDFVHVILANELLDNLPFRIARIEADGSMSEVAITCEGSVLVEACIPLDLPASFARRLAPLVQEVAQQLVSASSRTYEIPLALAAATWIDVARDHAERTLVFDYGASTSTLALRGQTDAGPSRDWLRTYAGHGRGASPLERVGEQDITIDVPFDQLVQPDEMSLQANWLRAHGIEELVAEGDRIWRERAAIGDLVALHARSRSIESEALLDPAGLGGFWVAEWS